MDNKNIEIAYKGICIDHKNNTIRLIDEDLDRNNVDMNVYLDKQDETSPDKELCFTWITISTYKFNTKL